MPKVGPRWARPDVDLRVTPPRPPRRPRQHRCACGCGEMAGWHPKTDTRKGVRKGQARRYLPGHKASRAAVERMKVENETAREHGEAEARRLIEEFEAELAQLLDEAAELGLNGDALVRHVYTDEMERKSIAIQVRRAALDGSKESANWLHARKHGNRTGGARGDAAAQSTTSPDFLNPTDSRDDLYDE